MSMGITRRSFFRNSALAGAGLYLGGRSAARAQSANDKLNLAVIGVSGRGKANLQHVSKEAVIVLCDVDENAAAEAREAFPKAKFVTDFRRIFDMNNIDAVVISTPDHTHAIPTMMALQSGRPVYCEKPLTHSLHEARTVREAAAKSGLATQMGTQIHATDNYRRVVELIQTGAIGPVTEVHCWAGGAWSGGGDRPADTPPVPDGLHYDLWIGPARYWPYNKAWVPASWRGWWNFGGGTLADMACHHMDLPFWALDLRYPRTIEAGGPPVHPESAPKWLIVQYEFGPRGEKPPVRLTWYSGDPRPKYFADKKTPPWGNGTLFVGKNGMLLADYDKYVLLPEEDFKDFTPPDPFIPNSIGHHEEWIEACKTGSPTTCNFDYSGALTEAVLLGNVSYRSGRKLEWDAKQMRIRNAPEAERFLSRDYRDGWVLPG